MLIIRKQIFLFWFNALQMSISSLAGKSKYTDVCEVFVLVMQNIWTEKSSNSCWQKPPCPLTENWYPGIISNTFAIRSLYHMASLVIFCKDQHQIWCHFTFSSLFRKKILSHYLIFLVQTRDPKKMGKLSMDEEEESDGVK